MPWYRPEAAWRPARAEWWLAGGMVLVCALVAESMAERLDHANQLLVYTSGMVYVALRCGPAATWTAMVASLLVYDLIHVQPRWSFTPTDPQYYFTFAVMLAVGGLVNHLVRRARAEAAAAEGERLRSTLLSAISHDFRTPLTSIVGAVTSLIEQPAALDEARRRALLHIVLAEARHMSALTSDLLDLTRMEEGAVRAECEWCPVDDLLDEALRLSALRLQAHPLDTHAPPDAVLWCDPRLLVQALVNLLDNAARHTPAGTPVRVALALGEREAVLSVADRGPGLPPGHEQDVLKKFYRGPGAQTGAGTGLGLAICAAVARLHSGRLVAANEEGGGARFSLHLPQAAGRPRVDQA